MRNRTQPGRPDQLRVLPERARGVDRLARGIDTLFDFFVRQIDADFPGDGVDWFNGDNPMNWSLFDMEEDEDKFDIQFY